METEDNIIFTDILTMLSDDEDGYNNLQTFMEREKIDKDFFIRNRLDYFFIWTNKKNFVHLYERKIGFGYNLSHLLFAKKNGLLISFNALVEIYKKDNRYIKIPYEKYIIESVEV